MSMTSKQVNWSGYYAQIHDVCPYSSYAYREGKLLHTQYKSWSMILQNESMLTPMKLWAVMYTDCPFTVEELEAWVNKRNSEQTVIQYYFSHPEHSPTGRATPVPVVIQQRRDILDMARKGVFDQGMETTQSPDSMVKRYETRGIVKDGRGRGRPGLPMKQETKDKIRATVLKQKRAN